MAPPPPHKSRRFSGQKNEDEAKQTTIQLTKATQLSQGQQLYLDNCSGYHFTDGKVDALAFPPLDGNQLINVSDPQGFLAVLLQSAQFPSLPQAPTRLTIADFGWRLNDK